MSTQMVLNSRLVVLLMIKVSASILAFDLQNINSEIRQLEKACIDYIHIDVMDGKFVPNTTPMNPNFVSSIKSNIPLDVHLMVENPHDVVEDFANAGAGMITIHVEAVKDVKKVVKHIKSLNILAGLAFRPNTNVEVIYPFLSIVDFVLVMTVMPGFAGQDFMWDAASNISKIKDHVKAKNLDVLISVDGGVNSDTKDICIKNGADILVSGSYIAKNNYPESVKTLKTTNFSEDL